MKSEELVASLEENSEYKRGEKRARVVPTFDFPPLLRLLLVVISKGRLLCAEKH